jgi:hypothetical protein
VIRKRRTGEAPQGTSKLTDAQLRAAIESSDATARRHEERGDPRAAAQALARASRNREELRRREGLTEDQPACTCGEGAAGGLAHCEGCAKAETTVVPAAKPARIATPYPPDDAVRDAEDLVTKWGSTHAVRALCVALNNRVAYSQSMDIADAPRVIELQRRYAQ